MTPKRTKKKIDEEQEQVELIPDPEFYDSDDDVIPDEDTPDEEEEDEIPNGNAEEKIGELNDRYLRLYSEYDNYRKRTMKEKIDLVKRASTGVITDLLPVLDDFERAIKAFSDTPDTDQVLKDGVILIYNKFLNTLTQKGLEQMETIGEPFDTDFHEAITTIPAPTPDMKEKVVDEVEKGYLLNGKVIRYAKVVVGS